MEEEEEEADSGVLASALAGPCREVEGEAAGDGTNAAVWPYLLHGASTTSAFDASALQE